MLVGVLLTVEWPFCIRLADGVEVYFPVMWTAAASAYLLGPAVLPVYWIAALFGFVLIVVLDGRGIVPAVGIAAESAKRYRGQPFAPASVVDGDLRHFLAVSEMAVRGFVATAVARAGAPLFGAVAIGELAVLVWHRTAPIPGRMAPVRWRQRLAAALGPDLVRATGFLDVSVVASLLLAHLYGGPLAFAAGSLLTLALHAVLKRLNDTRIESERQRRELLTMQEELDRRHRLSVIGQTASTVFHQIGRHHGAIGMFAHLLARGPREDDSAWVETAREHARRIGVSLDDANRVIDELLAFGQDRTLNLYPHSLPALVGECLDECRSRAAARGVTLEATALPDLEVALDKHKIKQAIGNVLDNAIDAAPAGTAVEVTGVIDNGLVRIAVRDRGSGIAEQIRDRLFAPFCTTKADGIGLGLALAKELVDAHGGTLAWEPATPGTVFVLALPRGA